MKKRGYRLGARVGRQEETRRRIVRATAELHAEVGPAATTISAVAERAGVQRLTVYRHFPDEASLYAACAAYSAEQSPPPDPALWAGIGDPAARLEAALGAMYSAYAADAEALALVLRDAERLPALREVLAPMEEYMRGAAGGLSVGWEVAPGADRAFAAALAHALDFWSWRSLAGQGLGAEAAARLMTCFVVAAARGDCRALE